MPLSSLDGAEHLSTFYNTSLLCVYLLIITHLRNYDATRSDVWVPCSSFSLHIRHRHLPYLEEKARAEKADKTDKTTKKGTGRKTFIFILTST